MLILDMLVGVFGVFLRSVFQVLSSVFQALLKFSQSLIPWEVL